MCAEGGGLRRGKGAARRPPMHSHPCIKLLLVGHHLGPVWEERTLHESVRSGGCWVQGICTSHVLCDSNPCMPRVSGGMGFFGVQGRGGGACAHMQHLQRSLPEEGGEVAVMRYNGQVVKNGCLKVQAGCPARHGGMLAGQSTLFGSAANTKAGQQGGKLCAHVGSGWASIQGTASKGG